MRWFIVVFLLSVVLITNAPRPTQAQQTVEGIFTVAWSSDGTLIAGGGTDGFLRIWDAATGDILLDIPDLQGGIWTMAWRPDSSTLAATDASGKIYLFAINSADQTYENIAVLHGHTAPIFNLAWSPDGTMLASASVFEEYAVRVWDGVTLSPEPFAEYGIGQEVYDLVWHPDGNRITLGTPAGIRLFDVNQTIKPANVDSFGIGPAVATLKLAWHIDGQRIVSATNTHALTMLDINPTSDGFPQEVFTIDAHTDLITDVAWHPDGTIFASASQDGTLRVWDGSTGKMLAEFPNKTELSTLALAWSPDGTQLAYGGMADTLHIVEIDLTPSE